MELSGKIRIRTRRILCLLLRSMLPFLQDCKLSGHASLELQCPFAPVRGGSCLNVKPRQRRAEPRHEEREQGGETSCEHQDLQKS